MPNYYKMTRITPKQFKINEFEFNITKLLINALGIEFESGFLLSFDDAPIICGDRYIAYTEYYKFLNRIPKDLAIFRPIRNEKHANIIIDMFDDLDIIESDNIEVTEFMKGTKKKYSGYLKCGNKKIDESFVKSAPSIPILKVSIIAKMLFDDYEYKQYKENLMKFLGKGDKKYESSND